MQAQEVVPIHAGICVSVVGTQTNPKLGREVVVDATAGLKSKTNITVSTKRQEWCPKLGSVIYRHPNKKLGPRYELAIVSEFKLRAYKNRMDEIHLSRLENQLMLVMA